MARGQQHQQRYLIESPAPGLYLHFAGKRLTVAPAANATPFATRADAILALQGTAAAGQPHEIVRVAA